MEPTRPFHLPFHDFDLLCAHREHLDDRQSIALAALENRRDDGHKVWFRNAQVLLGASCPFLDRYIACHADLPRRPCRRWAYCPACARQVGIRVKSRYVSRFRVGRWHAVTLSFVQDISFYQPLVSGPIEAWNACDRVLRGLMKHTPDLGAWWAEEFVATMLVPLEARAHVHGVVAGDIHTGDLEDALEQAIRATPGRPGYPSVVVKPLSFQEDLFNWLGYCVKPQTLLGIHDDYSAHSPPGLNEGWKLKMNTGLRDAVEWYGRISRNRRKFRSVGILSPRSRWYIGVPTKKLSGQREFIRTFLKN